MKIDVYNNQGEKSETMEVSDRVFGAPWNPALVHQAYVILSGNSRRPWAHAKGRGEVRGGGKKPWRQKGTGRARHGSIRSPLWRGGGVTFGPSNERDYSRKINKKMRQKALFSVLSKKVKDGEAKVVEAFNLEAPKTKIFYSLLARLMDGSAYRTRTGRLMPSTLVVAESRNTNVALAGRNIAKSTVIFPDALGLLECLNHRLIFFEKKAIEALEKKYLKHVNI